MTFKDSWEKTSQKVQLDSASLQEILDQAFPGKTILSHRLLPGGCVNLNYKVQLSNEKTPKILRVYLRDRDAAYREKKLAILIGDTVPIPSIVAIDEYQSYRFAIVEYREGILLRDLLLSKGSEIAEEALIEAGLVLAALQNYHFSSSGFFDSNLEIATSITQDSYATFALKRFQDPTTETIIGKETAIKLQSYLENSTSLFPDGLTTNLVHGDFGPENLLVQQCKGYWKLSAILDWEFAFSGSVLTDIANMLRYSHQTSPSYEKAFLHGVKQGGIHLPNDWRIRIAWLNLLALLDCLTRCSPKEHPNRCADICSLITNITQQLDWNYEHGSFS